MRVIGANPEHLDMVKRLEMAIDSEEGTPLGFASDLPSGPADSSLRCRAWAYDQCPLPSRPRAG